MCLGFLILKFMKPTLFLSCSRAFRMRPFVEKVWNLWSNACIFWNFIHYMQNTL